MSLFSSMWWRWLSKSTAIFFFDYISHHLNLNTYSGIAEVGLTKGWKSLKRVCHYLQEFTWKFWKNICDIDTILKYKTLLTIQANRSKNAHFLHFWYFSFFVKLICWLRLWERLCILLITSCKQNLCLTFEKHGQNASGILLQVWDCSWCLAELAVFEILNRGYSYEPVVSVDGRLEIKKLSIPIVGFEERNSLIVSCIAVVNSGKSWNVFQKFKSRRYWLYCWSAVNDI